jgi:hypothetical protein
MQKGKKKSNKLGMIIGISILIFLVFLWLFVLVTQDNQDETTSQIRPTIVEFCNNTRFILQDNFGNNVTGTAWVSRDSDIFEQVNLSELKIQKGIQYKLWIESKDFYVSPKYFNADCINKNDTRPNYVIIEAYKNANSEIVLNDEITWNKELSFDEGGSAYLSIRYFGQFNKNFIPFGGVLILEYPRNINYVTCYLDSAGDLSTNLKDHFYVIQNPKNTYDSFLLNHNFDDMKVRYTKIICTFKINTQQDRSELKDAKVYAEIVPGNYFIDNKNRLQLGLDREVEDYQFDFSLTGLGIINSSIGVEY